MRMGTVRENLVLGRYKGINISNNIMRVMRLCTRQYSRLRGFNRKGKLTDVILEKMEILLKAINMIISSSSLLTQYCRYRLI